MVANGCGDSRWKKWEPSKYFATAFLHPSFCSCASIASILALGQMPSFVPPHSNICMFARAASRVDVSCAARASYCRRRHVSQNTSRTSASQCRSCGMRLAATDFASATEDHSQDELRVSAAIWNL